MCCGTTGDTALQHGPRSRSLITSCASTVQVVIAQARRALRAGCDKIVRVSQSSQAPVRSGLFAMSLPSETARGDPPVKPAQATLSIQDACESCPAFEGGCPFGDAKAIATTASIADVKSCPAFAKPEVGAGVGCPFKGTATMDELWAKLSQLPPSHLAMPPLLETLGRVSRDTCAWHGGPRGSVRARVLPPFHRRSVFVYRSLSHQASSIKPT